LEGGYPTKEKMTSYGAGSSSSGHIQQEQADENMGRATKRALERSAENQEPDHLKVHAARFKFATSVPALSDVAVAQNQCHKTLLALFSTVDVSAESKTLAFAQSPQEARGRLLRIQHHLANCK
jgi:hypothetical protein